MAEVFSGFVAGYAMSLVFTGFAAFMVVDARSRVPFLARAIAPNINAVMLAVPISLFAFLIWTLVGMILGLIYRAAEQSLPSGGLGSPNWPFTLGILLLGLSSLAVVLYAWQPRHWSGRWQVVAMAALFVGLFGWGMPHMARAVL